MSSGASFSFFNLPPGEEAMPITPLYDDTVPQRKDDLAGLKAELYDEVKIKGDEPLDDGDLKWTQPKIDKDIYLP